MKLQENRPMKLHIDDIRRDFNLDRNDIKALSKPDTYVNGRKFI